VCYVQRILAGSAHFRSAPRYCTYRLAAFLALNFLLSPCLHAQFEKQNPTTLVVRVAIGSYQHAAPANLSVQLQDGFGAIEHEGHTDTRGMVEFSTFTATKRIRIFGPGIVEHEEIIQIEPVENRKMVNIIVKEDSKRANASSLPAGVVPAGRLNVPEKAQKEFQKGSESLSKKDWAEAKKHFAAAIAAYQPYDVAYNGLGMAAASSGNPQEARTAFQKAITLNDKFAEAHRNLARISLSEKKFDEVDQLLTQSLDSDPLNSWALAYAAYAELQLRKFDMALVHARKAHEVDHKGLASSHIVAALALEATDRSPDAAREYRLYLEEEPNGRDAARAKDRLATLGEQAPQ
jgi:tetratricopeptide (TPR) repeat protein